MNYGNENLLDSVIPTYYIMYVKEVDDNWIFKNMIDTSHATLSLDAYYFWDLALETRTGRLLDRIRDNKANKECISNVTEAALVKHLHKKIREDFAVHLQFKGVEFILGLEYVDTNFAVYVNEY